MRLDCQVKIWDDWRQVKERLQVQTDRIGQQRQQTYREWKARERFVVISPVEPMWFLIEQLTGFEIGLPLLAEQPDLAADIRYTSTKISTAKQGGGYIYHCDHSIPPTVGLERYARVIELVREHGSYNTT